LKFDFGTPDNPKTATLYLRTCTTNRREENVPAIKNGRYPKLTKSDTVTPENMEIAITKAELKARPM
jgi:hypothetical protein